MPGGGRSAAEFLNRGCTIFESVVCCIEGIREFGIEDLVILKVVSSHRAEVRGNRVNLKDSNDFNGFNDLNAFKDLHNGPPTYVYTA